MDEIREQKRDAPNVDLLVRQSNNADSPSGEKLIAVTIPRLSFRPVVNRTIYLDCDS